MLFSKSQQYVLYAVTFRCSFCATFALQTSLQSSCLGLVLLSTHSGLNLGGLDYNTNWHFVPLVEKANTLE